MNATSPGGAMAEHRRTGWVATRFGRIGIRRFMLLIAILALALASGIECYRLRQRSMLYQTKAREFQVMERMSQNGVDFWKPKLREMEKEAALIRSGTLTGDRTLRRSMSLILDRYAESMHLSAGAEALKQQSLEQLARPRDESARILRSGLVTLQKNVEYFSSMIRKYEHASMRPWLSVEPDPPGPAPQLRD